MLATYAGGDAVAALRCGENKHLKVDERVNRPFGSTQDKGSGSESAQFERYLYAFDLATGEVKWQLTTQLPLNLRMTISEGVLYLGGEKEVFKFE